MPPTAETVQFRFPFLTGCFDASPRLAVTWRLCVWPPACLSFSASLSCNTRGGKEGRSWGVMFGLRPSLSEYGLHWEEEENQNMSHFLQGIWQNGLSHWASAGAGRNLNGKALLHQWNHVKQNCSWWIKACYFKTHRSCAGGGSIRKLTFFL